VRFSALFQTGTGAQLASCTKRTGSLYPGGLGVLYGVDHFLPSTADVTVALYLYYPLWFFTACSRMTHIFHQDRGIRATSTAPIFTNLLFVEIK
jgi:hypothetical protein